MKRRIQGLVSSTGKAAKRSWREDDEGDQGAPDSRPDDDEDAPPPPPPKRAAVKASIDSDEEAWDALEAAGDFEEPSATGGPNPVVWMDLSVAGKPRGRVFFELFRDVVPKTAENFRQLCLGVPEDAERPEGPKFGYKGTELYKIVMGKMAEGGEFDRAASGKEFKDENFDLQHTKGGLLTMANDGPHSNTSRFQVTYRAQPALDGKQVVFGQALENPAEGSAERLSALYWAAGMGTVSGQPLEPVVIEDCGECDEATALQLLGAPKPPDAEPEPASARYSRAGIHIGQMVDAVSRESVVDMLELTELVLESFEWQHKKAERAGGPERLRKAGEVEAGCKALRVVLEEIDFKAGDVQGPNGKQSRKAKTQTFRVRDLEELLQKMY